jgi:hypothetical protein
MLIGIGTLLLWNWLWSHGRILLLLLLMRMRLIRLLIESELAATIAPPMCRSVVVDIAGIGLHQVEQRVDVGLQSLNGIGGTIELALKSGHIST